MFEKDLKSLGQVAALPYYPNARFYFYFKIFLESK